MCQLNAKLCTKFASVNYPLDSTKNKMKLMSNTLAYSVGLTNYKGKDV